MALKLENYSNRFTGKTFFYGNASHGFYELLTWLQKNNPKKSPNIVLPVYIPAKLYRYVLAAGYEPKFYDITLDCQFDPFEVYNLIDDNTRAVFAIHYFGIPSSNIHGLKKLTDQAGTFLIEDCAHTINSRSKDRELGSIGDAAIFSTRKMLQMPSGGILVLNSQPWKFEPSYDKRVRSMFTACKMTRSRLKYKYYYFTQGNDPLNLAWIPRTGYINFSENQSVDVKQMSWLSEKYIHSVDLEKISRKRRDNYEYVLNHLQGLPAIEIVGPKNEENEHCEQIGDRLYINDSFTPYSFPILTSLGGRNGVQQALCQAGVGCGAGWPEAPFNLRGFPHTTELSFRLLELPIHQGINRHQLDRMIECLQKYPSAKNKYSGQRNKVSIIR